MPRSLTLWHLKGFALVGMGLHLADASEQLCLTIYKFRNARSHKLRMVQITGYLRFRYRQEHMQIVSVLDGFESNKDQSMPVLPASENMATGKGTMGQPTATAGFD